MTRDKEPLGVKPFLYGLAIGVVLVVGLNTSDRVIKIDLAKVEQKQYIDKSSFNDAKAALDIKGATQ